MLCELGKRSPKYQVAFDERSGTESNGSGDSLRDMKLGEWRKTSSMQDVTSSSRGFLRGVTVWLSNHGVRSAQDHNGHPDSLSEKYGTKEAGVKFLDLIAATTLGTASELNNVPLAPMHRKTRFCLTLKHTGMDAF